MTDNIAISLTDVSKVFKRYRRPVDRLKELLLPGKQRSEDFWALQDINLEIPKGETLGIIGRNGSGKSTLLQIIAGTLQPTTGKLQVNGRVSALLELGSGFNPEFTGIENVFFSGQIMGLSEKEIQNKLESIASFADIGDFINQPVKTYSSGMYVRLAFALAVTIQPEILIVDEALSVGDTAFQLKSFERLKQLIGYGATVVLVSHDIGAIQSVCQTALMLDNGRVAQIGDTSTVTEYYFLKIRAAQEKKSYGKNAIKSKQSNSSHSPIAFGTEEGYILNTQFASTGGDSNVTTVGDTVTLEVNVSYVGVLSNPAVSLYVQNKQSLTISGKSVPLFIPKAEHTQDNQRRHVVFSFEANLAPGDYFLTVALENRHSDSVFYPVDKQPRALALKVIPGKTRKFLGLTDMAISALEKKDSFSA